MPMSWLTQLHYRCAMDMRLGAFGVLINRISERPMALFGTVQSA